jgi:hypothetical protein
VRSYQGEFEGHGTQHAKKLSKISRNYWLDNLKETEHSEDLDVNGEIKLNRCKRNKTRGVWTGITWLMIRANGRLLQHDYVPSGYI